jgi:hypothetical protein
VSSEEQKQEMEMQVLDAVGNFGIPAVIEALIKACAVAYDVEEAQEPVNWPRLETYKHFAKRLEELIR